ncbi:MAG TPA: hypothetical protein VHA33_23715 [Candidatus Angelobacter sp.]|jgi:hypothetical protein|nr:hypothetical protein [Candidatus Angelobacter sp.]
MKRSFRLFLSSPSDVDGERLRAAQVVERLKRDFQNFQFELIRWEDSYYTARESFQAQILKPSDCDLVISIFWKRLGTELPSQFNRSDGSGRTGTEYEFEEAVEAAAQRNPRSPEIIVYRKTAPIYFSELAVDRERAEKRALDAFWARWFHDEKGHLTAGFQSFDSAEDFEQNLERDLRLWFDRQIRRTTWSIETQGPPFRGLKAFESQHAETVFRQERRDRPRSGQTCDCTRT